MQEVIQKGTDKTGQSLFSAFFRSLKDKLASHYEYLVFFVVPVFLFLLWTNPAILNPVQFGWTMSGDLGQHFTGWHMFRNDAWHFPLMNHALGTYPDVISAVFTDSNPLFSILFKLLDPVLPQHFQFIGLWYLFGLFVNYVVLYKTLHLVNRTKSTCLLGALLIALFPSYFWRIGHDTLTAHFVITLLLFWLFKKETKYTYFFMMAITALAASIHIYLTVFVLVAIPAKVFYEHGFSLTSFVKAILYSVLNLLVLLAVAAALGFFGYAGESFGFGQYSMNLNALFNPVGRSRFLPDLPMTGPEQGEGYQYLGLGLMFFLLLALSSRVKFLTRQQFWALFVFFVTPLTLYALSNRITFGNHVLFSYPLPDILVKIANTFRASGRFFWGVVYLAAIVSFFKLSGKYTDKTLTVILSVCIVLQLADVRFRHPFPEQTPLNPQLSRILAQNRTAFTHINTSAIPFTERIEAPFLEVLIAATDNKIPVTSIYFSRKKPGSILLSCRQSLKVGGICLYPKKPAFFPENTHLYAINHFYLVAPESRPLTGLEPGPTDRPRTIVLEDKDLLVKTENAFRQGRLVRSKPDATGIVSYGPYIQLPSGHYRISVAYRASENSDAAFELVSSDRRIGPEETLPASRDRAAGEFDIDEPVQDVEIRTRLNGSGELTVHRITIERLD